MIKPANQVSQVCKVTQVCQAWWNARRNSNDVDQSPYAQELLARLGWKDLSRIDTNNGDSQLSNAAYLLDSGRGVTIAAYFILPGILEPPSAILDRGLDFCQCTRLLVNGTRRLDFDYAFITDLNRFYFYDARQDELLLHADSIDLFAADMAEVLTFDAGSESELSGLRRNPRSVLARQLREWRQRWTDAFVSASEQDEDTAGLILDRLLVLRYLFDYDVMKRPDWRLRKRFSEVVETAFSPQPIGCGKALTTLLHDIWFDWQADIFRPIPVLDSILEQDAVAARLLREFTLVSKTKFAAEVILESFNYGDAMEKARVRLVPEPDEERARYLGRVTLESIDQARIHVDVLDEGYRAILYWFDKLIEVYDRLGIEFQTQHPSAAERPHSLDLFAWSELNAADPDSIRDRIQHAVEKGVIIYCNSARQSRTARLLLYLHTIQTYAETNTPFVLFPQIEPSIQPRPKHLDADKWRTHPASRNPVGAFNAM